jgi:ectoine hydroxylase-related dioxygenase (phytanoyl-CoA dioxygenase family)
VVTPDHRGEAASIWPQDGVDSLQIHRFRVQSWSMEQPAPTRRTSRGFDVDAHVDRMDADGYTVIEDYMTAAQLAAFRDGLAPHLGSYRGRNSFEGRATERIYTLVGRGKVFEEIVEDDRLLALLGRFLAPHFLLSANHAICIYPGEAAQTPHHDDSFYPFPHPRPSISISTIGAIDAFTAENGGTVMYPGSHLWPMNRRAAFSRAAEAGRPTGESAISLTMPAGALCVFHGTLIQGAGANRSDAARLAYTNHYCEPWARTQENFYLGIPRARLRGMSPTLLGLLGYDLRRPKDIMGQVGGYHPTKVLDPDFVLPVDRPAPG